MNSLAEQYIADTFDGLLHVGGTPLPISGRVTVFDGVGGASSLSIGSGGNGATINGELYTTNNIVVGGGGILIPTGILTITNGGVNITNGSVNITTGGINIGQGDLNMTGTLRIAGNLGTTGTTWHTGDVIVSGSIDSNGLTTNNFRCGAIGYPNYRGGTQDFLMQGDSDQLVFKPRSIFLSEMISVIYPVGSVYLAMYDTNPSTLFPGTTWTSIAGGYGLIGVGTGIDNNSITRAIGVGKNGGEYNHTITIAEMPAHRHTGVGVVRGDTGSDTNNAFTEIGTNDSTYHEDNGHTSAAAKSQAKPSAPSKLDSELIIKNTGGGDPHNNMPPTFGVYVFQRTA